MKLDCAVQDAVSTGCSNRQIFQQLVGLSIMLLPLEDNVGCR